MADEIERFEYQRFIPEEGRGGTYSVTLNIGGKLVGPMSPKDADARGFPLSKIFAGIDAQVLVEVVALREQADADAATIQRLEAKSENLTAELASAKAASFVSLAGELKFETPGALATKEPTP